MEKTRIKVKQYISHEEHQEYKRSVPDHVKMELHREDHKPSGCSRYFYWVEGVALDWDGCEGLLVQVGVKLMLKKLNEIEVLQD